MGNFYAGICKVAAIYVKYKTIKCHYLLVKRHWLNIFILVELMRDIMIATFTNKDPKHLYFI